VTCLLALLFQDTQKLKSTFQKNEIMRFHEMNEHFQETDSAGCQRVLIIKYHKLLAAEYKQKQLLWIFPERSAVNTDLPNRAYENHVGFQCSPLHIVKRT
jgi:hypothetical protein